MNLIQCEHIPFTKFGVQFHFITFLIISYKKNNNDIKLHAQIAKKNTLFQLMQSLKMNYHLRHNIATNRTSIRRDLMNLGNGVKAENINDRKMPHFH